MWIAKARLKIYGPSADQNVEKQEDKIAKDNPKMSAMPTHNHLYKPQPLRIIKVTSKPAPPSSSHHPKTSCPPSAPPVEYSPAASLSIEPDPDVIPTPPFPGRSSSGSRIIRTTHAPFPASASQQLLAQMNISRKPASPREEDLLHQMATLHALQGTQGFGMRRLEEEERRGRRKLRK